MSTSLLLKDKTAVIYGAGGAIGHAVARTFAREGARVFLTGRSLSKAEVPAKEIVAVGGAAEAAQVDALDENAVAEHLDSVIKKTGGVDISFNAVGLRNTTLQAVPLVHLDVEEFMRPIAEHVRANFLTARLAGRHMTAKGSGVIMTVTSIGIHAKAHGITRDQFRNMVADRAHRKRLPTLQEMAEVVTFIASDRASGIAGTMANMSLGAIPD